MLAVDQVARSATPHSRPMAQWNSLFLFSKTIKGYQSCETLLVLPILAVDQVARRATPHSGPMAQYNSLFLFSKTLKNHQSCKHWLLETKQEAANCCWLPLGAPAALLLCFTASAAILAHLVALQPHTYTIYVVELEFLSIWY